MSSRRDFLRRTSGVAVACASGTILATLLESCTSIKFISAVTQDKKLAVSKTEFENELFVVVKSPALPFPVYLLKNSE